MNHTDNPLLQPWNTPFGLPPFEKIQTRHFVPAFREALRRHNLELDLIGSDDKPADFHNTILAFEVSGSSLRRLLSVFFNLTSAHTNNELQEAEKIINPEFAAHESQVLTRRDLFDRVNHLYQSRDDLGLDFEDRLLLEDIWRRFSRAGALLDDAARLRVMTINERISTLATDFSRNILTATNDFELLLTQPDEVSGLPRSVLASSRSQAAERGYDSGYLFTVARSSFTPFMEFADRRDLREKLFNAYTTCAATGDSDNRSIAMEIAKLRGERARLLGYQTHAEYMLDDRMAATTTAVDELLQRLWLPAQEKVQQEARDLQEKIQELGDNHRLAPWDWWYYSEKIRRQRFDLDPVEVKNYFQLENVQAGAFECAQRLYGLTFEKLNNLPLYHPEVEAYRVKDAAGQGLGLFLVDYFARGSKRGGAWMSTFRDQARYPHPVEPIVINVCNFVKAGEGQPTLLSFDEVRTLFHEFGHGLHGLLSQVTYESLSGTNVKQDFVELPSQIMEHWALEPEVLAGYARHHQTGEPLPATLVDKIRSAQTFNQGFATTEYLAASFLDMAWHGPGGDQVSDVQQFEEKLFEALDLVPEVSSRYKSSYFQHIFAGESYSAGYYSYIWAEVLDADGFDAFKSNGIFDPATADRFRKEILERGGTMNPMEAYRRFRGADPAIEPLLAQRGLIES